MNELLDFSHGRHNFPYLSLCYFDFILVQSNKIFDNFVGLFNFELNIQILPQPKYNVAINPAGFAKNILAISDIDKHIGGEVSFSVQEEQGALAF